MTPGASTTDQPNLTIVGPYSIWCKKLVPKNCTRIMTHVLETRASFWYTFLVPNSWACITPIMVRASNVNYDEQVVTCKFNSRSCAAGLVLELVTA